MKTATIPTHFHANTPPALRKLLERLSKSGQPVRIYCGDTDTGRAWLEEYDIIGHIGRSTGTQPIPLLVPDGDSGGPGLLDHCVVKVAALGGKTLWKNPKFHVPELFIEHSPGTNPRFPYEVRLRQEDAVQARFKTYPEACAYIAFMNGVEHNPGK